MPYTYTQPAQKALEKQAPSKVFLAQGYFNVAEIIGNEIQNIDYGPLYWEGAPTTTITGGQYSLQVGYSLVSSLNLFRIRSWVEMNTFNGSLKMIYKNMGDTLGVPNALIATDMDFNNLQAVVDPTAVNHTILPPGTYGATPNLADVLYNYPGTLEEAEGVSVMRNGVCGYVNPFDLNYDNVAANPTYHTSNRIATQLILDRNAYSPKLPYLPSKEANSNCDVLPLGHLCFYGELDDYIARNDMPRGFSELFALLPAWDVSVVINGTAIPMGKLEDSVSFNITTNTQNNSSGYPKTIQYLMVTERTAEITGKLSDLDPAMFALINDYKIRTLEDSTTSEVLGFSINMSNNTTLLTDYGIVLRSWYQGGVMVEIRFNKGNFTMDGAIEGHNVATRLGFKYTPTANGTMYIAANKGFLIKVPFTATIEANNV